MALAGVDETTTHLVQAAQCGDREAFGELVERDWARLVRLARSVVGELEAEDVVEDSLIVAWSRLSRLTDPARFGSWVGRIVFRRCLRASRRQRGRRSLDSVPEGSTSPDPAGRLAVWQVLARLAPRQRAVLHLTVVEGMTDAEIAPLLGLVPASVRAHRRRARASVARIVRGGAA